MLICQRNWIEQGCRNYCFERIGLELCDKKFWTFIKNSDSEIGILKRLVAVTAGNLRALEVIIAITRVVVARNSVERAWIIEEPLTLTIITLTVIIKSKGTIYSKWVRTTWKNKNSWIITAIIFR